MNEVLKKLRLTNENPVLIVNAPESYKKVMEDIQAHIDTTISEKYKFIQIFAYTMEDANINIHALLNALEDDGYFWICYPKGTSKKYKSDINRTSVGEILSNFKFKPVSQVSIDDDWTAMRFNHVDKQVSNLQMEF